METDVKGKTREELEQEKGPINYKELQRFFAKGAIVAVAKDLDLIKVALCLQSDDSKTLKAWMNQKKVVRANDHHALRWYEGNSTLNAVTMTPWVLVQESE